MVVGGARECGAGTSNGALASAYRYDVMNRLKTDSLRTRGVSAWNAVGSTFHSSYSYDGNGNLTSLYRLNELTNQMDALTYGYDAGTNRLNHIDDAQGAAVNVTDLADQSANNYVYDATGNLTQDIAEGINANGISWTPYNKVRSITQTGDSPTNKVEYLYDAQGNRVLKRYYNNTSSTLRTTTWYVRDGRGNVVGIYVKPSGSDATLTEAPVYGTSRIGTAYNLGQYSTSTGQTKALYGTVHSRPLGEKVYELTDHLGNVRATTSDVTILHSGSRDAELRTWTDYYPFGMEMPSRAWRVGASPRYGYNGKENDDEVKGEGNQIDYGARAYDPRATRWFSRDPLASKYPGVSPYAMTGNSPILFAELDGRDYGVKINHDNKTITVYADYAVIGGTERALQQGLDEWLDENGKFRYDADVDGVTVSYQVVFDLKIQLDDGDYTRPVNKFRILPGQEFNRHPLVKGRSIAGFNLLDEIVLDEDYSSSSVTGPSIKKHEIGHNLGIGHTFETVMDPKMEQGRPKGFKPVLTVTPSIIEEMLGQAKLGPKRNEPKPDDGRGILVDRQEQGLAPRDFESGSVKKND